MLTERVLASELRPGDRLVLPSTGQWIPVYAVDIDGSEIRIGTGPMHGNKEGARGVIRCVTDTHFIRETRDSLDIAAHVPAISQEKP